MGKNDFLDIIEGGLQHSIHKWAHYLPLYHRYFKRFRKTATPNNKVRLLEIGVQNGGSLDMWCKYFGKENCELVGVDIDNSCKALEKDNIKIIIGDQENKEFLTNEILTLDKFDIIIDDGGHTMNQQIITYEVLFDHVKPGGIFLCEDVHTSYWQNYGGGLHSPSSFVEYTKKLIDKLNGYHYNGADEFTKTCLGIYYHDSMVFFEKSPLPIQHPYAKHWHVTQKID